MTDPKQIAETVTALMLEHEALLFRVGVTTSDPEAMVYSEDGKPVRKVKDITSPAKKAADLLQSLAAENAALKAEAEAARLAAELAEARAGESEGVPVSTLLREISQELQRARSKFPGKNVTFAALIEEVGELATALFEEGSDRVRKEAVQVAVMAMRIILDGDHTYEPWRESKGLDPLDPVLRTRTALTTETPA